MLSAAKHLAAKHRAHSMAWSIPIIRPACITDVGNSYYYSNWGASGFCFAYPHVSPKPSYVALAVLTQILDGARLFRIVPITTPTVYAVEFRKRDRSRITCLWTLRGKRIIELHIAGVRRFTLSDMMGNEAYVSLDKGRKTIEISNEPLYLTTSKPISQLIAGVAQHEGRPHGATFMISRLDRVSDWYEETERNLDLEMYNFTCPREKAILSTARLRCSRESITSLA